MIDNKFLVEENVFTNSQNDAYISLKLLQIMRLHTIKNLSTLS